MWSVLLTDWQTGPLSRIHKHMMKWIYRRWHHLSEFDPARATILTVWMHVTMRDVFPLQIIFLLVFKCIQMTHVVLQWATATTRAVPNAYRNVAMFLDGTLRPTCMPCPKEPPPGVTQYELQRAPYTRHKKRHGFKMHALVVPCGIATHWHGPCDERRHDMFILTDSGIVPRLQGLTIDNVDYMVYADSAHPVIRNLMCPVPRINASPESRACSKVECHDGCR